MGPLFAGGSPSTGLAARLSHFKPDAYPGMNRGAIVCESADTGPQSGESGN